MTALSHLRVVDLTHYIAGPYCTKLMAGFGADVIKVERPKTGDPLRSIGPFAGDRDGLERSIPFLWYNTRKKSVTIDLKSAWGCALCKKLVEGADIVVENFAPGVMARLGLSYGTLRAINPRIVLTSISNFGQTGPYSHYQAEEITEYAMSGAMYATGDPGREPLAPGPAVTQLSAGMMAYVAGLMGYFRSVETGVGDWIDLSIHETALDNIEVAMAEFLHRSKVAKRTNDDHALVPWQIYPCRDGHAAIIGSPIRHWLKGAELFKQPELTSGKYDHVAKRIANRDQIRKLMAPWLSGNNKKDIFHAGQARGLAFSYLSSLTEVMESPQHEARKFFTTTEHPEVGKLKMAGAPFRPQQTPWLQHRAPLLGEHTEMILSQQLQLSSEEITQLQTEGIV